MILIPVAVVLVEAIQALILALLATGCVLIFIDTTRKLFGALGVVGTWVVDHVEGLLTDVQNGLQARADAAVTPLAHTLAAIPSHLNQWGDKAIDALYWLYARIQAVSVSATTTIVDATVGTLATAVTAVQSSLSLLSSTVIPALSASIVSVADQARIRIDALAASVEALPQAIYSQVNTMIGGAVAAVEADIARAEARAIAAAQSIEAGIADQVTGLEREIATVIEPQIGAAATAAQQAQGTIDGALPGLLERIGALEHTPAVDLTREDTAISDILKWVNDCGDPLCTHLKPEIPNIVAVAQLLELGTLAALITNAIVDPNGAADETDATVVAPVTMVAGLLESLAA